MPPDMFILLSLLAFMIFKMGIVYTVLIVIVLPSCIFSFVALCEHFEKQRRERFNRTPKEPMV